MKKNIFVYCAIFGLVLLLFIFRFYRFYEFVIFLSDQGRDAIILRQIILFDHFPAIGASSSVGQVYLGPFYYYLIAPFLKIFNFDPVGPAFGVAIISIIGIIGSFFIVKKEISKTVALVFLALMTFSAVLTEYSRFSWNPNLLPYFSFISLYLFYTWLKKPNLFKGAALGGLFGFTIQLHYLGVLIFLPMMTMSIFHFVKNRSISKYIASGIISIVFFLFSISPLIIFDLRHNFLNLNQFIKLFQNGIASQNQSFISNFSETASKLLLHTFQTQANSGVLIILIIAILSMGFIAYKKIKSDFLLLNIINVIIFLICFSFVEGPRNPHYYGASIMSLYFVFASTILLIKKLYIRLIFASVFLCIFAMLNISKMYFLFGFGSNQINKARNIAESFSKYIKDQPIQTVALPDYESDTQYRYFLKLKDYDLIPYDSPAQAEELYIICDKKCDPLSSGQWQIATFENKRLTDKWEIEDVTIYKIIHKDKK